MNRADRLPRADFELDDRAYQTLLATIDGWQIHIRQLQDRQRSKDRDDPTRARDMGIDR